MDFTEAVSKPLGEQASPYVVPARLGYSGAREILLSGFESREMYKAYVTWLESGEAHVAFGDWADEKGML